MSTECHVIKTERMQLRQQIWQLCKTDVGLETFVCDYFEAVHRRFALGMQPDAKITLLLSLVSEEDVAAALDKARSHPFCEGPSHPNIAPVQVRIESTPLPGQYPTLSERVTGPARRESGEKPQWNHFEVRLKEVQSLSVIGWLDRHRSKLGGFACLDRESHRGRPVVPRLDLCFGKTLCIEAYPSVFRNNQDPYPPQAWFDPETDCSPIHVCYSPLPGFFRPWYEIAVSWEECPSTSLLTWKIELRDTDARTLVRFVRKLNPFL